MKTLRYIFGITIVLLSYCCVYSGVNAQGLSEGPARLFYTLPKGTSSSQRIQVSNPSSSPMDVGVSVGDWNYDSLGNNRMLEAGSLTNSCAKWLQVLPGSYFSLQPGEQKWLTINMVVPPDADTSIAVHTAMLYLNQVNDVNSKQVNGASIRLRVRIGVKIYHSFSALNTGYMEIANFQDTSIIGKDKMTEHALCIQLNNTGKLWVDGSIKWELLNEQNGKSIKLDEDDFYSLPGDYRYIIKKLPEGLEKGKYSVTAVINYGNKNDLKIAELEFIN